MAANSAVAEVFRTNVAEALRNQGHTITEMAEALEMSRTSLSRVLSGYETVTLPRAEKIAEFLGISLAKLVTEKKLQKTA